MTSAHTKGGPSLVLLKNVPKVTKPLRNGHGMGEYPTRLGRKEGKGERLRSSTETTAMFTMACDSRVNTLHEKWKNKILPLQEHVEIHQDGYKKAPHQNESTKESFLTGKKQTSKPNKVIRSAPRSRHVALCGCIRGVTRSCQISLRKRHLLRGRRSSTLVAGTS